MDLLLTDTEVRVLGCLLEKEMATPDYYPLSLNGLINGCNQKSNRHPVVSYDDDTALYAIKGLQERKLIRQSNVGRVTKYEQVFSDELNLINKEKAVICVLLLRGPQTIGEIRGRSERLYGFSDLEEVQNTIATLEESQLVKKLPRQPGRKESRYAHLLSGEPAEQPAADTVNKDSERIIVRRKDESETGLKEKVEILEVELMKLRQEFEDFKSQFE